jgi:hypothetical protein
MQARYDLGFYIERIFNPSEVLRGHLDTQNEGCFNLVELSLLFFTRLRELFFKRFAEEP